LRLLPAESAHRAAIRGLPWLPARRLSAWPRLRTSLAGLELPHPVGLAAGFDKNGEAWAALLRQGFACVEVGTVTPRPQLGNPRPRLFRLVEDEALVNRLGFNNGGAMALAARLAERDRKLGVVGVNIGMNKDAADPVIDYAHGLELLGGLADYVTVNVSSPNTPGLRALQKRAALDRLLAALAPKRAGTPLFLKVAPDLDEADEADIAALCVEHGIDALIVSNTTIDRPATLRSPLASEPGGLSGRPLFDRSTALLARMAARLAGRVPLIGVGGISSGADAYAKIRAGASAVQLYTALIYQGPGVVPRILAELDALLARDGFDTVGAAIGCDRDQNAS
jgi:dihydroorotate dehydrogenase